MSDVIGRGVIEVTADSSKLQAGINDAKRSISSLGTATVEANTKASASIDRYIKRLEIQNATSRLSTREAELYKLALRGASDAQLKAADAALKMAEAQQKTVSRGSEVVSTLSTMKTALVGVGAALLGGFSISYFSGIVKGSIEAAAKLKDLSEQTGASVESLAALKGIGKLSETGLDSISGAMGKFAKGLAGVDEESKGVPMALKAIGLEFDKLKNMKPEEAMLTVAKAMEEYEDGTGKASVAMALYGKEGAKMIPFLKDLATVGELNGKVTKEQAEMADEYEKNLVRLKASSEAWKRDLAMGLLPTLDLVAKTMLGLSNETGGFRDEIHKLSTDGSVKSWSEGAVEALAFVADAAHGVVIVFQTVGRVIASQYAVINSMTNGLSADKFALMAANPAAGVATISKQLAENLKGAKSVFSASGEDLNNVLSQELIGSKFLKRFQQIKADRSFIAPGVTEWIDGQEPKKKVEANWGYKPGAAKSEQSDYEKLIRTLNEKIAVQQEELGVTEKLTDAQKEYAKFQTQIKEGYIKLSPTELKQAEELWAKFLKQAEDLKQKAKEKVYEAARMNIQSLADSFARDIQNKRASLEIMPAPKRALIESTNAVDEKGRSESDKLAAQLRKGEIDVDQYTRLMSELNAVLERQRGEVSALASVQEKLNASFEYGAQKGLQSYLDEVANVAKSSEQLITKAFQGMEDALVNFVTTGKLDFKSFANSIIADLARISIRQNITGPLAQWMQGGSSGSSSFGGIFSAITSFFGGGSSSSLPQLWANAMGGVYSAPSLSAYSNGVYGPGQQKFFTFADGGAFGTFAEPGAGFEAVMPLKRGSDGKLGVQVSGNQQQMPPIIINIHGSQSAPDVRRSAAQGAREALAAFSGAQRYA